MSESIPTAPGSRPEPPRPYGATFSPVPSQTTLPPPPPPAVVGAAVGRPTFVPRDNAAVGGAAAGSGGFPTVPVSPPVAPTSAGSGSGGFGGTTSGDPAAGTTSAPARSAAQPSAQPNGTARGSRIGLAEVRGDELPIDEILTELVRLGGSDIHLTTGAPPMIRISGSLRPLEKFDRVDPEALRRSLYGIITQRQRETFETELELDFSYAVRGLARFRVNLYQQRESIGAAFRVIPYEIKPLEALGIPPVVGTFAGLPRGLVLVTGPTGSGKSTTLASIIDLANRTREDHIMTVEDPIEFLHRHKKCVVNQREVGQDTHSFASALKHVLRQDPDIILVGEMRDLETISVALTAAETGHLVFATLHTQDAAQTIDRIIDVFPSHQQAQVRTQLAGTLQGVVCQTLCKRSDAEGRVVATEVLIATPAIRNLIREGKTHQMYSAMQAGAQQGMHTLDQHLADLVRNGRISYEVGLEKCHHVEDYNRLTGRFSGQTQGQAGLQDVNAAAGTYGQGM